MMAFICKSMHPGLGIQVESVWGRGACQAAMDPCLPQLRASLRQVIGFELQSKLRLCICTVNEVLSRSHIVRAEIAMSLISIISPYLEYTP